MLSRPALVVCGLVVLLAGACEARAASTGTRYLYLIRHAIYDRDSTVVDDRAGNGLNALGRKQATLTAERLAHLPIRFARVVTSDYRRARETAEPIGRALHLTPAIDTLLHECMPTSERADLMRGAAPAEVAACDSQLSRAWSAYVRPASAADEHEALVCHGNVIRWFVARTLGADLGHWARMDIANGSLTVLAVRSDGSARLVLFSDASHIPIPQQTWSGRGAGWGQPAATRK